MNLHTIEKNGVIITFIQSDTAVITDVSSALDLMATVSYESQSRHIVINKAAICEDFFRLSTGVAGEILQKFVNYNTRLAITGDFSIYKSKPLKDFIRESNRGRHVFFVTSSDEAVEMLMSVLN